MKKTKQKKVEQTGIYIFFNIMYDFSKKVENDVPKFF